MDNQVLPPEVMDVIAVQFGIFSPKDICNMSVVHVGELERFSDPKLGPRDTTTLCSTCSGKIYDCPGYFGHLKLAKPMFHIGFMKTVLWVLQCVCYYCSENLAEKDGDPYKKL